jgi:uncharacterized LabA/DUF88 family protein
MTLAFLIDADNLSSKNLIKEAYSQIDELALGPITIRRAYGAANKLRVLASVLKSLDIEAIPNFQISKNTTDMALAVETMELACTVEGLGAVVIGSGDRDYLPLVKRLQARGIRTVCIGQKSSMAKHAVDAYDQVIFVGDKANEEAKPTGLKMKSAGKSDPQKTAGLNQSVQKGIVKSVAKKTAKPDSKPVAKPQITAEAV